MVALRAPMYALLVEFYFSGGLTERHSECYVPRLTLVAGHKNQFDIFVSSKVNAWCVLSFQGIHKRSLLLEVLPVVASNLELQRLYTEYQEQLDSLKTSSS